jgi:hypothetical protein
MATRASTQPTTVRTTTIEVTQPDNFEKLEAKFKLIRYLIPDRLRNERGDMYARVHAQLKEQLDHPYKSYKYDKLDGAPRWAVYVLYPQGTEPKSVTVQDTKIESRPIRFHDLEMHEMLKLLQVQLFTSKGGEKFVGRDECLIYARSERKDKHVCIGIDIKGDLANQPEAKTQTFKVIGRATYIIKQTREIGTGEQHKYPYYMTQDSNQAGKPLFRLVKPSQVLVLKQKGRLYRSWSDEKDRATLNYYSLDEVEQSRGYLLDSFIKEFGEFLSEYGFQLRAVTRQFQKFTPDPEFAKFELPLRLLQTVHVLDVRKNRSIVITEYLNLFRTHTPNLEFAPLAELTPDFAGAVLFLMDYKKDDFDADGILPNEKDEYGELYAKFPYITKQGFNVNMFSKLEKGKRPTNRTEYLNYALLSTDEVRLQLAVSLNQLFLKDVLLRKRKAEGRVPRLTPSYVYVTRQTVEKISYTVALYVEDNTFTLLDLRDPEQSEQFRVYLQALSIDWDANLRAVAKRRKKDDEGNLSQYDLVIAQGVFAEIDDPDERVLYEFDTILERQERKATTFPTTYFKVSERYDELKTTGMLSHSELIRGGFIDQDGNPRDREVRANPSIALWQQLRNFDAVLDELQIQKPEISLDELCEDPTWLPRLASALGDTPQNGKHNSRSIKGIYRRLELFPSDRAGNLTPTYQGIWYDAQNRFIIGDANSLKLTGQARAHLVRQFVIYQGHDKFDLSAMLNATSVRFVRHNQYTVYPYPFHLIDLYIDNFLKHQPVQ